MLAFMTGSMWWGQDSNSGLPGCSPSVPEKLPHCHCAGGSWKPVLFAGGLDEAPKSVLTHCLERVSLRGLCTWSGLPRTTCGGLQESLQAHRDSQALQRALDQECHAARSQT